MKNDKLTTVEQLFSSSSSSLLVEDVDSNVKIKKGAACNDFRENLRTIRNNLFLNQQRELVNKTAGMVPPSAAASALPPLASSTMKVSSLRKDAGKLKPRNDSVKSAIDSKNAGNVFDFKMILKQHQLGIEKQRSLKSLTQKSEHQQQMMPISKMLQHEQLQPQQAFPAPIKPSISKGLLAKAKSNTSLEQSRLKDMFRSEHHELEILKLRKLNDIKESLTRTDSFKARNEIEEMQNPRITIESVHSISLSSEVKDCRKEKQLNNVEICLNSPSTSKCSDSIDNGRARSSRRENSKIAQLINKLSDNNIKFNNPVAHHPKQSTVNHDASILVPSSAAESNGQKAATLRIKPNPKQQKPPLQPSKSQTSSNLLLQPEGQQKNNLSTQQPQIMINSSNSTMSSCNPGQSCTSLNNLVGESDQDGGLLGGSKKFNGTFTVRSRIQYFESKSSEDLLLRTTASLASRNKDLFLKKYDNPIRSDPSRRIDQFSLLRTVGRGSFGRVLLCFHKETKKFYAAKVLAKEKLFKNRQIEHTINEKNVLNACDHPNIVKLFFTFKDNSNLYLIVEFACHGDLYAFLKKQKCFDETLSKFYAANIFLAIEYLHVNSIVYRDLKPENILITTNGYLKLTDFGFAKRIENKTYTLCGTPDYLSPEVLNQQPYSMSVDWWAFGVFIYELNTGKAPFVGVDQEALFKAIQKGEYVIPDKFSTSLTHICKRLMDKDIDKRLGCAKRGSDDVRDHKWFSGINWMKIYKQTHTAPYIPQKITPADYIAQKPCKPEEPLRINKLNQYAKEFESF